MLDHIAGSWLLKGKLDGKQVTQDVEAHSVFRHEYLRLHEVSREKDDHSDPAYEAIILVNWDSKRSQYACLWLDSTAGGTLTSQGTCRGKPGAGFIPYEIHLPRRLRYMGVATSIM